MKTFQKVLLGIGAIIFSTQVQAMMYPLRPYEPNTASWLTRDPIGEKGGLNLYGFVGNNPISSIDALGLCKCGVKSLKAISDGWKVNPASITFTFHVVAKFRKDAGYNPSCCKLIQWVQDRTTFDGVMSSPDGGGPHDGNLHIDANPYVSDDINDPANYNRMGDGYDTDPLDNVLNYTDTPTRGAGTGVVLGGDLKFKIIVYDSCNGFKKFRAHNLESIGMGLGLKLIMVLNSYATSPAVNIFGVV